MASDPDPADAALVAAAMSAMEKYTGAVPGYRRAHAHGHGFVGHFESTSEVAGLTVAEHLQGGRVAVVVRLSNGAGSPYAPDLQSARHGATLGLGIEFALPSGGRATWAAPNMAAFPAGTPQEFIAVTTAQRRNARGHRNPLRLLAFVVRHRRTRARPDGARRPPSDPQLRGGGLPRPARLLPGRWRGPSAGLPLPLDRDDGGRAHGHQAASRALAARSSSSRRCASAWRADRSAGS